MQGKTAVFAVDLYKFGTPPLFRTPGRVAILLEVTLVFLSAL